MFFLLQSHQLAPQRVSCKPATHHTHTNATLLGPTSKAQEQYSSTSPMARQYIPPWGVPTSLC